MRVLVVHVLGNCALTYIGPTMLDIICARIPVFTVFGSDFSVLLLRVGI